jgi:hypothetical protein
VERADPTHPDQTDVKRARVRHAKSGSGVIRHSRTGPAIAFR